MEGYIRLNDVLIIVYDSGTGVAAQYLKVQDPTGIIPDGEKYIELVTAEYGIEIFKIVLSKPDLPNDTVYKQKTLPLESTGWIVLYNISCPERGSVDQNTSSDEYWDYVNIKGKLNLHHVVKQIFLSDTNGRGSRGNEFLKAIGFEFRLVGWRKTFYVDQPFLHIEEKLDRDIIRVIKVNRLQYQIQIRQDYANVVSIPEIIYERCSTGSIIQYDGTSINSIGNPAIVRNYQNSDRWEEKVEWDRIVNAPNNNVTYPLVYDENQNLTLKQIIPPTISNARVGIYISTNYFSGDDVFGWGTRTAGETDSITVGVMPESTARRYLSFKLRRRQVSSPERTELNTQTPSTPIESAASVRWIGGHLRIRKDLIVEKGTDFIIFQFLPDPNPTNRVPCLALYIRDDGCLWLSNRSNPRGPNSNTAETIVLREWNLGRYNLGTWEEIVCKVDFKWDSTGIIQFWRSGKLILDITGHPTTFYDPGKNTPWFKFGIYYNWWGSRPDYYITPVDEIEICWCDFRLGGYQASYTDMKPLSINDAVQPLRVNIDADFINTQEIRYKGVNLFNGSANQYFQGDGAKGNKTDILLGNSGNQITESIENLFSSGFYTVSNTASGIPTLASGDLMVFRTSNSTVTQIYNTITNAMYIRRRSAGAWTPWLELITGQITATTTRKGIVNQGVAVANAADTNPTQTEFNALLTSLRNAGIIST